MTGRLRPGGTAGVLAVLAGVTLLVAGCGGGSSGPRVANTASRTSASTPAASGNPTTALAAALAFSRCMRSNGVTNYPDPSSNARPLSLNHIDPNSPTFRRAYEACREYAPNGGVGPPAPSVAQLRFALAFAQCVRKRGFPQFPDPLTMYVLKPTFTLGQGMYFPVNGTYQVASPAFMHAARACGVQL